jgi:hypothetical protein
MSNRIYPVTKEQLENGQFSIVQSHHVPSGSPKFFFQYKPFGKEIDGWDQDDAIKQLHSHVLAFAQQLVANKFDVALREVVEGVEEASNNEGPANLYSDEVFHLMRYALKF